MNATIRLFKAVPLTDWSGGIGRASDPYVSTINRETIPKGFVFSPDLIAAYRGRSIRDLIDAVDGLYGVDSQKLNQSFHKSFATVRDAPYRQLVIDQMTHYVSTYGAKSLGTFKDENIYIPVEELDAPQVNAKSFPLVVIRSMTHAELRVALLELLASGVALSEQTIADVLDVAKLIRLSVEDVERIKNREAQVALYESLDMAPTSPVEFLRYVVYRAIGSTLLIKSKGAVAALKAAAEAANKGEGADLRILFQRYDEAVGVERLGEVFNRFKPLFLALRADNELRPVINRIRRAAETNHKPLAEDYLNGVTAAIIKSTTYLRLTGATKSKLADKMFNLHRLRTELANPSVNIFRKIRLAQALAVRAHTDIDSIVYKVRNGKSYVADFGPLTDDQRMRFREAFDVTMQSIANDLRPSLEGKAFFIPNGLVVGLPATEKQFSGNFPSGTYVYVPRGENLVAGVYWEDVDGYTVDLDLSVANAGGKIGWDGRYRQGGGVQFSGDITAAPHGATEAYNFTHDHNGSWLMSLNYFNFNDRIPVPYKLLIGTAAAASINGNYVIDPNRLVIETPMTLEVVQQSLGVIVADPKVGHRFYLSEIDTGGGISARYDNNAERARRFTAAANDAAPTLNDILLWAGALPVSSAEDADEGFDFSPAALDKTRLLTLLSRR